MFPYGPRPGGSGGGGGAAAAPPGHRSLRGGLRRPRPLPPPQASPPPLPAPRGSPPPPAPPFRGGGEKGIVPARGRGGLPRGGATLSGGGGGFPARRRRIAGARGATPAAAPPLPPPPPNPLQLCRLQILRVRAGWCDVCGGLGGLRAGWREGERKNF